MLSFLDFFGMVAAQQIGPQRLERIVTEEPAGAIDAEPSVLQYDRVMCTKLALGYATSLEAVYRARPTIRGGVAVDLACGPGHYTICLARHLGYERVTGIDLSAPMVETANRNAVVQGLEGRVGFEVGDVTKLDRLEGGAFDLVSFTGAAHHMPDLDTVAHILRQMERIAKPEGLVMVMDLARLRTAELTERYVSILAKDYAERGLSDFFEGFRGSMYAEWTPREFRTAIPTESGRWWCHLVPWGLPTVQMAFGLPVGRKGAFVRRGFKANENPLVRQWYPRWEQAVSRQWARDTLKEWKLMRLSLLLARKWMIPPHKEGLPGSGQR
jgi:ubiquinone/menaquinone biosynthesis C-methylase UbiE